MLIQIKGRNNGDRAQAGLNGGRSGERLSVDPLRHGAVPGMGKLLPSSNDYVSIGPCARSAPLPGIRGGDRRDTGCTA
jgi:hypothetical protein